MNKIKKLTSFFLSLCMIFVLSAFFSVSSDASSGKWVAGWGTPAVKGGVSIGSSVLRRSGGIQLRDVIPANTTVRSLFTTTIGGTKIRLKFSNYYGTDSITINEATIAKTDSDNDRKIKSDTLTQVTFNGGNKSVTIAAGSEIYSDAIDFTTTNLDELSVSTYFKNSTNIYVCGLFGGETYLASSLGNRTHKENISPLASKMQLKASTITYETMPFLTRADIWASPDSYAFVMIGDSTITNNSYLLLEQKLNANGIYNISVIMSGIIGNRVLYNGVGLTGSFFGDALVSRYARDALNIPGVKYIMIKAGLNDVLHPSSKSMNAPYASVDDIINGYINLSNQSKAKGIYTSLAERPPYKGYTRSFIVSDDITWSQKGHDMLTEINRWIVNKSVPTYFNSYVDISKLVDPNDSKRIIPYLTTDGAHLSHNGQIAFVDLIPEKVYGVNRNLKDLASILNVNPYKTPSSETTTKKTESTTKKSSSGGNSSSSTNSGRSGLAIITPGNNSNSNSSSSEGTTVKSRTGNVIAISPAASSEAASAAADENTTQNANQLVISGGEIGDNGSGNSGGSANTISVDTDSTNTGAVAGLQAHKTLISVLLIVIASIAVVVVVILILIRNGRLSPSITRVSSGLGKTGKKRRGGV